MRRALLVIVCAFGLIAPAAASAASGVAVPTYFGEPGVSTAASPFKFIALTAGHGTILERLLRVRPAERTRTRLRGLFGVAGAAYDGSTTGLSGDGTTLVLEGVASVYPPTSTRLVVIDTATLRVTEQISLRGLFAIDAISPTGRWLYLIHYRSQSNPTNYEVRAYDLTERRLLAKPIVDPREPDEKMQGVPVTRAMSADGRWAYTLYQRPNDAPFIHALDTAGLTARCVDVPLLTNFDLSQAKLALSRDGTLSVLDSGTPVALMDTRTFVVSAPATAAPVRHPVTPGTHTSSSGWALLLAPLAAVIGLVLVLRRRRSGPKPLPPTPRDAST